MSATKIKGMRAFQTMVAVLAAVFALLAAGCATEWMPDPGMPPPPPPPDGCGVITEC
ncbi:hypothetical protein [Mycobacterium decipiens]|uniref:hypothetical protein n=1 Tax=Mycobacterium decipiens TaxID=1430326 RepID=UPI0013FD32DA|nr:hypothetical protein [Mycobacterium decipiens]